MRPLSLLIALLLGTASAHAAQPLESQAAVWAGTLGHGTVVVAQRRADGWHYGVGGAPADAKAETLLFEIGSISKVFTGLLLAHAVHDGRLALDDTLAQRLPVEFDDPDTGAITLRQLASHTSCLPRLPTNMTTVNLADPYASYDDDTLFAFLGGHALATKGPCDADYSNLGFGVLGVVLERAYGQPWETLVREKITTPLGMVDTAQHLAPEQQARFVAGWDGGAQASPWTFDAIAGAGALRSTAQDMARFADALMQGKDGPLADVWDTFATVQAEMPSAGARIALGLMHSKFDGEDGYGHDGGTGGYRTLIHVQPRQHAATIVLAANAQANPAGWVNAWRRSDMAAGGTAEAAIAPDRIDDYPGVYALGTQARFTVLRRDDGLVVRLTGQPFLPVHARSTDEFFYKDVDAQLSFKRGKDGKVAAVVLHQNGRNIEAKRTDAPPPAIRFPAPAALQPLVGEYDFSAGGAGARLTMTARAGQLFTQLTGQPAFPVFNVADDRYELDVVEAALQFERNVDGTIAAVVLHQNGAQIRAPRIVED